MKKETGECDNLLKLIQDMLVEMDDAENYMGETEFRIRLKEICEPCDLVKHNKSALCWWFLPIVVILFKIGTFFPNELKESHQNHENPIR